MARTGRTRTREAVLVVLIGIAAASTATAETDLPRPIRQALLLLGWLSNETPRIEVVTSRPPDASPLAAAWVRFDDGGCAMPVIYVSAGGHVYRDAERGDYRAQIELAGILAHERWHILHGRGEVGAYNAQLSIMEYLHAGSLRLTEVRKALRQAEQQQKPDGRNGSAEAHCGPK